MIRTLIILCVMAASLTHGFKVHEQMTPAEVQAIFGSDEVPDYEVVPVAHAFHRKSRSHRIVQFTSFEQPTTLYLEPADGYLAGSRTPVYKARSNKSNESLIEFEKIPNAVKSKYKFYQDFNNMAAVMIQHDAHGKALIDGVIDTVAIRSLPSRFRSQFKKDKRDVQNDSLQSNRSAYHSNLEHTHHHVIYKIPMAEKVEHARGPVPRASDTTRTRNRVPELVHPQVLIIVESSLFAVFNQTVDDIVPYLLSFWNAVDLRYRAFRNPDVRINIAGILLAEDANATPYIIKNRVTLEGFDDNKIQVSNALKQNAQFLYPESSYNEDSNVLSMNRLGFNFDLVITMTTYDMCQFHPQYLELTEDDYDLPEEVVKNACITLGYAYYTGACSYNKTTSLMEAVGIIEDKGGFAGIIPTAHEVGHLMGASHHARNEHQCPTNDGYIMSYELILSDKSFIWSNCSAYSIKKFLEREKRAQCLFDIPDTGSQISRILPGEVFSRDELCDRFMGTKSCSNQLNNCVQLHCTVKGSTDMCEHVQYTAVPEGSPCGQKDYCINGRCISKSQRSVLLELGTTPKPRPRPNLGVRNQFFGSRFKYIQ